MGNDASYGSRVTLRSAVILSIISLAYLLLSRYLIGYKPDEVVLVLAFNALYYASAISRKFILGFSVFVIYWIIFDYMKAFPNYNYSAVHIGDLYDFEKHLFGIHYHNQLLTPNEYWRLNGCTFLDVMTGIFYLCWVPVPIAFAVYLFFTRRREFLLFLMTFVLVNFLGFIVYYTYPAAPPWYVQYHGFAFLPHTPGNTGGLAKFDAFFNVNIFKSIYSKGSNVFAAMPSLHSSYPVIVVYYALKNKLGWVNIFFFIVMFGIWFSAVYLSHHYVLDVLAGVLTAATGIALFNLLLKINWFNSFINGYEKAIR